MKVWACLLVAGAVMAGAGYIAADSGWFLLVVLVSPFVGIAVTEVAIRRWGLP